MTTIDQLLSWNPDALGTSAEGLNADRKALVDLQDEMDGGGAPATWQGDAATAAGQSHDRLYDRLADLVAAVSPVVGALDTAQAEISAAKESVLSAKSTIAGEGWILEESGGSVQVSAPASTDAWLDQVRMTALAQQIAEALQRATDADTQLASVLNGARLGQYDAASGTLANAALPPHLRGLSDQQIADYLVEHPDRDFDLEALTTHQQQVLGQTIADRYESYADGDALERWRTGDAPLPTEEDVEGLNELLDAYGDDSTVATSLLDRVGPEGLLHVQQTMLAAVPPIEGDGGDADVVGRSQRLWGEVLAAGTRGLDDGGGGTSEQVSQEWLSGLVDAAGKGALEVDGLDIDDTYRIDMMGMRHPSGYELLAPLLRDDGHGSQMLNTVGSAMESYERAYVEENGVSPWMNAGPDQRALDLTGGAPEDTFDLSDYDRPLGNDPMGGLMEGLSHNPDAAREFLSGGDDRVDYYTHERIWPDGEYSPYPDLPSEREHFGDALLAATTQHVQPDDTVAADLATEAVAAAGKDDVDLAPELRSDFGQMLGHYMPSVYDSLQHGDQIEGGDADPWLPGEQRPNLLADFDERALRNTLDDVGRSEDAGNIVSDAAARYANLGYDHVFSGEGQSPEAAAQDPMSQWSTRLDLADSRVSSPYADVLASLGGGYGDQLRADGLALDAENSARGDAAWEVGGWIAEQGVGKIPVVGSFGDFLIGHGVDAITAANDVDTTGQVNQAIGQHIFETDGAAQAMAQNAVYRNLPIDVLDPALVADDGSRIPMSEWGSDQRDAWERAQDSAGLPAIGHQLQEQMSAQVDEAYGRRDTFYGHTGDQSMDEGG